MFEKEKVTIVFILVVGAAIFGFFALFVALFVSSYQKRKQLLVAEKENLSQKLEFEVMKAQEEIRNSTLKEVSIELHDSVCQILGVALLYLKNESSDIQALKEKVQPLIQQALNETRDLSSGFDSLMATGISIEKLIKKQAEHIRNTTSVNITTEFSGNVAKMESNMQLIIYRIFQELLHNTLKHSGAKEIKCRINRIGDKVQFFFSDNGYGFDINESHNGKGLRNIQERVKMLNGTCELFSEMGMGTTYLIGFETENEDGI